MHIDKGSFFILIATLGAGGAAGYVASERKVFVPPSPPATPPAPPKETASASVAVPPPPPPKPAPTCDDAVGTPGACPPPGYPAEEGGCGAFPTKRCNDFKQAMRPRVAERAVACLNALTPAQRCDPIRVGLCAHTALMSACSVGDAVDPGDAAADEVTSHCQAILRGCEGVTVGPTLLDCRATLAGMSVLGRDRIVDCMKTHCTDKGLLWCETQIDAK